MANRRINVNSVLALLAVAACVLATITALQVRRDHSTDDRNAAAIEAARHLVVTLTSISGATANADINAVLAASTGTFKNQFLTQRSSYVSALNDARVSSQGSVAAAGVVSSSPQQVVVLVAGSATVKGPTGSAQKRSYRMRLTLVEASSRWLVSKLQLVA